MFCIARHSKKPLPCFIQITMRQKAARESTQAQPVKTESVGYDQA
jgi:hypothetical protein